MIEWEAVVSEAILYDIIRFKQQIEKEKHPLISDCIVGYHSLAIVYNEKIPQVDHEIEQLKQIYTLTPEHLKKKTTHWTIPVCYDTRFGIDLEDIAKQKNQSIETIIQLHTNTIYTVYFIGFLPGFLYLGGLDKQLHTPRKTTPRLQVKKGAVAIGGSQTGVYPQQSAGGWNIIGNSPLPFFDVNKPQPCFAASGDTIQFEPINLKTYETIEEDIRNKTFNLKKFQRSG